MRGSFVRTWLAVAGALVVAFPLAGRAQGTGVQPSPSAWRAPLAVGATLGLAALGELGRANGHSGTATGWRSTQPYYKRYAHGVAAFALTDVGVDMGLAPWRSASAVCAAGVAYEMVQGHVSRLDIATDCTAALLDVLWRAAIPGSRGAAPRPALFLGAVAAGLVVVKVSGVDRDRGGYRDTFDDVAQFNMPAVRAVSAFAVARAGTRLGAPAWAAATATCAAGTFLERGGRARAVALESTCLGAGASLLWRALRRAR